MYRMAPAIFIVKTDAAKGIEQPNGRCMALGEHATNRILLSHSVEILMIEHTQQLQDSERTTRPPAFDSHPVLQKKPWMVKHDSSVDTQ